MSKLARNGTGESVWCDQIFRRKRGQENTHFPCSSDYEQDWQPYPVDPYSAICDGHAVFAKVIFMTRYIFITVNTLLIENEQLKNISV